ncbi:NAD-dependent epimerase/dehydratase family protein [Candidatus Parcubacteria bacterium]|nr:MAG: NAD-dependent epimerase/dehydratase family protein [Candidatus Parcubacteria bacterium]
MHRILVTGGCGFVGRHLVRRLSENKNNKITVVDDLSTGLKAEKWPEHLKVDTPEFIYEDCIDFFKRSKEHFNVVFHLAAIVEGRLTIEGSPLKVARDLIIDASLFRWAIKTRPDKIVYFSSSAAYPIQLQTREHHVPLAEYMLDVSRGDIGMPDMSYGWSKLTGEFLSYLAASKYNLDVVIYRPFSGYGEDQDFSYPFPAIIRRILKSKGEPINVWGSGEQSRDFIYIEDVVSCVLQTYEKMSGAEALNIGTGKRTTFIDLTMQACEIIGKKANINLLKDKPEGVFARYCDPKKQRELGFSPKYSLSAGIKIVAEYIAKHI